MNEIPESIFKFLGLRRETGSHLTSLLLKFYISQQRLLFVVSISRSVLLTLHRKFIIKGNGRVIKVYGER